MEEKVRAAFAVADELALKAPQECYQGIFNAVFHAMMIDASSLTASGADGRDILPDGRPSTCKHCGGNFRDGGNTEILGTLCGKCFIVGHRGSDCGEQCVPVRGFPAPKLDRG